MGITVDGEVKCPDSVGPEKSSTVFYNDAVESDPSEKIDSVSFQRATSGRPSDPRIL